jgi:hypothetical protein
MKRYPLCVLALAVLSAVAAGWALAASGGNPNPGVVPIGARVGGLTYSDWGDAFWQWVVSTPAADCPLLDGAGPDQFSGPVFLLANAGAVPGESNIAECSVNVGRHQALLLPLATVNLGPAEVCVAADPCGPSAEGQVATMRECAAACMDQIADLYASVDGNPLQDLGQYRVHSSQPFTCLYPEGSWLSGEYPGGTIGDEAGVIPVAVADGYYLLLSPLSKGQHTVSYDASWPQFGEGTVAGVIYHITVE